MSVSYSLAEIRNGTGFAKGVRFLIEANEDASKPAAGAAVAAQDAIARVADALEDFATTVMNDPRLPADMRQSLEGLYQNIVLPTVREQRKQALASRDAEEPQQDDDITVDISAGDDARMQEICDILIAKHGWKSARTGLMAEKEFTGIRHGDGSGKLFVVPRLSMAFQVQWGWENGPVTLVPINCTPEWTANEVNASVEAYVEKLRAKVRSEIGAAPVEPPDNDDQDEGMSP